MVVTVSRATAVPSESAGHFAWRVETVEGRLDWGRAWALLHPGQQAFVPKALFVRCLSTIRASRPRSIRVLTVRSVTITIPGLSRGRIAADTVRLRWVYGSATPSQYVSLTVVIVGNRWRWITSAASRTSFRRMYFCQ